jgi:hypothetical protein
MDRAEKSKQSPRFALSRAEAAAISEVEGLVMTPEMHSAFAEFDRESLSVEDRIAAIKQRYQSKL